MGESCLVRLLIGFHFFSLMLPLGFIGELRLDLIVVEKRSPGRVSAGFALFQLFVDGAFGFGHKCNLRKKGTITKLTHQPAFV